jgi:hypothetical protein
VRLSWVLGAALFVAAPVSAEPTVEVPGGTVSGSTVEGDAVFRGIPYAAPPLGELRWRPPAPVVSWSGVRDVSKPAPACLQKSEGWNKAHWLYASEDCLTLDIRTPSLTGKRPVMVWIHGGSNRSGSSAGPADSNMSDHGVVHVGIQYRLGVRRGQRPVRLRIHTGQHDVLESGPQPAQPAQVGGGEQQRRRRQTGHPRPRPERLGHPPLGVLTGAEQVRAVGHRRAGVQQLLDESEPTRSLPDAMSRARLP